MHSRTNGGHVGDMLRLELGIGMRATVLMSVRGFSCGMRFTEDEVNCSSADCSRFALQYVVQSKPVN